MCELIKIRTLVSTLQSQTKLANYWLLLIVANFPTFRARCFIPQPCDTCRLGSLLVTIRLHRFAFPCLPTGNLAALQELIVARHFRCCHTRCHLESLIGLLRHMAKVVSARSMSSFFFCAFCKCNHLLHLNCEFHWGGITFSQHDM